MISFSYHLVLSLTSVIVKLNIIKLRFSVLKLLILGLFRINKVLLLLARTLSLTLLNTVLENEILTFVDFKAK